MGQIVVGVDGSDGAARALRWAVQESVYRDLPVVGAMTWGYLDQHHVGGSTEFEPGYTEAAAAETLDSYIVGAVGDDAAASVERLVINDLTARGLLDATKDADLLVLGARGLGGFRGLLLGSVSQACLHHATCPVAIVHPADSTRASDTPRVVVGIDGSPGSRTALEWALDEARARQAGLDIVHAWSAPYAMGYSYGAVVDMAVYEESARLLLDGAVQASDTHGIAGPIRKILEPNGASFSLLEAARGADVLVVGTRGVGGFAGMLLGSVSHQVTQHADCPVVVVPIP